MRTISKNEARQRVADGENVYIVYQYDEHNDCLAQIELNNGSLCTIVSRKDVDELVNVRYRIITDKSELPGTDTKSDAEDDEADEQVALTDEQVVLTVPNMLVDNLYEMEGDVARIIGIYHGDKFVRDSAAFALDTLTKADDAVRGLRMALAAANDDRKGE